MKYTYYFFALILAALVACSGEEVAEPPGLVAPFASTPTVDGNFDPGEWDDAMAISPDTASTVWVKHDGTNFYLAMNGQGGNIYVLNDGRIFVLHASASLGWSEFSSTTPGSWTLERGYDWNLFGLQERSAEEISEGILGYLSEKGWAASLGNMGDQDASEFVISFEWLNLTSDSEAGEYIRIPRLMVSSHAHFPGGVDIIWPVDAVAIDSVDHGHSLVSIDLDTSDWGEIYISPNR